MAEARTWPALVIEAPAPDSPAGVEELLAALLDDFGPTAIEDLAVHPLPAEGLWDVSFPTLPPTPPAPLKWRVFFDGTEARSRARDAVSRHLPQLAVTTEDLPDEDWAARSQRELRRVDVGPFIIAPPWDLPGTVPDGSALLIIEPSMGFGTGHHATTRLCLRVLATFDVRGCRVLDIGTGSGVLAMAAAARGAADVQGIDIDPEALQSAEAGAALNGLDGLVAFTRADFRSAPLPQADLVLANLTGSTIIASATALVRLVGPGGHLVVSGFTGEERPAVFEAMRELSLVRTEDEDGWCAMGFRVR